MADPNSKQTVEEPNPLWPLPEDSDRAAMAYEPNRIPRLTVDPTVALVLELGIRQLAGLLENEQDHSKHLQHRWEDLGRWQNRLLALIGRIADGERIGEADSGSCSAGAR